MNGQTGTDSTGEVAERAEAGLALRSFAADEAQDISLGIFADALRLADEVEACEITVAQAYEFLDELEKDLAEAKAEA